jgi:hypothetical protein
MRAPDASSMAGGSRRRIGAAARQAAERAADGRLARTWSIFAAAIAISAWRDQQTERTRKC